MMARKILGCVLLVLAFFSIKYYINLEKYAGPITFSRAWIVLGIGLIIFGTYFIFSKIKVLSIVPQNVKILIIALAVIVFGGIVILEGIIIYEGNKTDNSNTDYVIVLGAGLRGTKMSVSLTYRMESAVEFARKHPDIKIIVSGGQGKYEDITEASAMKAYLINHGIDESRIIEEDKSTDTSENFKFSKKKIEEIDKRENIKVTVITNNFHMFRAKMLAKRCGLEPYGYPAELQSFLEPNYYFREVFALVKSYLFDR